MRFLQIFLCPNISWNVRQLEKLNIFIVHVNNDQTPLCHTVESPKYLRQKCCLSKCSIVQGFFGIQHLIPIKYWVRIEWFNSNFWNWLPSPLVSKNLISFCFFIFCSSLESFEYVILDRKKDKMPNIFFWHSHVYFHQNKLSLSSLIGNIFKLQ